MKSEHRHDLKTNELERIASEWTHASERYVHQHTYQLVAAAVVVIAVLVGIVVWKSGAGSTDRQAWQALLNASNAPDFANVADKYRGTPVAAWARLREAEVEVYSAMQLMFTDRPAGKSELKKAQENYEEVIADKSTPADVLERALFGLARVREALPSEKNPTPSKINDAAIEMYQRLLTQFPETVYKETAESRIAALRTGTAQDFYVWFDSQNPKPSDRELPKDLAVPPLPEPAGSGKTGAVKDTKPETTAPPTKEEAAGAKSAPAKPNTAGSAAKAGTKQPATPGGPVLPQPQSK